MVITDKFVYIHIGKTGGTFVEKVLDRLSKESQVYFNTANPADREAFGSIDQHETAAEIPEAYAGRNRLFSVRHPFDHYVSHYEYGVWKRPGTQLDGEKAKARFADYPDLSFGDFLLAINDWGLRVPPRGAGPRPWEPGLFRRANIGFLTWNYIRFCFPDPLQVIENLDFYMQEDNWRRELPDAHFLRTHRLNRDLYDFLVANGYDAGKLEFILGLERILPAGSMRKARTWETYYTSELRAYVREKERFIFAMFPEFDR